MSKRVSKKTKEPVEVPKQELTEEGIKNLSERLKKYIEYQTNSDEDLTNSFGENEGEKYSMGLVSPLTNIINYKIPITHKFYTKAEKYLLENKDKEGYKDLSKNFRTYYKKYPPKSQEEKQLEKVNYLYTRAKKSNEQTVDIYRLLEKLKLLIVDLPVGVNKVETIVNGKKKIRLEANSQFDEMINVLEKNGIVYDKDVTENVTKKIAELTPKKPKTDLEKHGEKLQAQVDSVRKALGQGSSTVSKDKLLGEYTYNGETIFIYSNNNDVYSINNITGQRLILSPDDLVEIDGNYSYKGIQLTSPGAQAVEPAQLSTAYNTSLIIAEGEPEAGATTPFDDYLPKFIELYAELKKPFAAKERHDLSKLSKEELVGELEFLQNIVKNKSPKNLYTPPIVPPVVIVSSDTAEIQGPEFVAETTEVTYDTIEEVISKKQENDALAAAAEQNKLDLLEESRLERANIATAGTIVQSGNTLGSTTALGSAGPEQGPEQLPVPEEKVIPESTTGGSATLPFKERYHTFSLKEYFEDSVYPKWDLTLEKNTMSSDLSESRRIKIMDDIIKNYGEVLFIEKRFGSTVEEFTELIELQTCLLRNCDLGGRLPQLVSVDYNQINKMKNLAMSIDANQQEQTAVQQEANAQAIENQLTGGQLNVQTEQEYKYEKAYDKYEEIQARGVADLPIKKYEPTEIIITETPITIANQDTLVVEQRFIKKIDAKTINNFDTSDTLNINYW